MPGGFDPREPCLVVVASSGSRGDLWRTADGRGVGPAAGLRGRSHRQGHGQRVPGRYRGAPFRIDGLLASGARDPLASFVAPAPATAPAPGAAAGGSAGPWLLSKHAHSGADPEPRWGERLIEATRIAFVWLNQEYATACGTAARSGQHAGDRLRHLQRRRGGAARAGAGPRRTARALVRCGGGDRAERRDRGRECSRGCASTGGAAGPRELEVRRAARLRQPQRPAAALRPARRAGDRRGAGRPRRLHSACTEPGAQISRARRDVRGATLAAQRGRCACAPARRGHSSPMRCGSDTSQLAGPAVAVDRHHLCQQCLCSPAARTSRPAAMAFASRRHADGRPRALEPTRSGARLFSDSNGLPPTAGIEIVRDDGAGRRPRQCRCQRAVGRRPRSRCMRARLTGAAAQDPALAARLAAGLRETLQMRAEPGDRPVIVLHGRGDGLIAGQPQFASMVCGGRAVAARTASEGSLRYCEVVDGQHFDAFLGLPGFGDALRADAALPARRDGPNGIASLRRRASRWRRARCCARVPRAASDAEGGVEPLCAAPPRRSCAPRPAANDRITRHDVASCMSGTEPPGMGVSAAC